MTAKSRRHKLDKRRKSDEHPQPRRTEAEARREACKREHPAGKKFEGWKVHSVSLVPAGEGEGHIESIEGKSVELEFDTDYLDPEAFDLLTGQEVGIVARGLGDHGELTPEELHEEIRSQGAPDAETSSGGWATASAEEIIGDVRRFSEYARKPESGRWLGPIGL